MQKIVKGKNQVLATGIIGSEPLYSHKVYGEAFYTMNLHVDRYSHKTDMIPLMVSERLMDMNMDYVGRVVRIKGQFRSHNKKEGEHRKLILAVFVKEFELMATEAEEVSQPGNSPNDIYIEGFVCKTPVYRRTPKGREISDVLVAVNRKFGKSDYLPCICWGRNAKYAEQFKVGERVQLWGRVQSREYEKTISEHEVEKKMAYEVSVDRITALKEGDIIEE